MTGKLGGAATTSALLSMMCAALLALASSEALAAPDESTELLGHSQWNSFIEQRLAVGRAALAPRGPKRVQLERLRSQKAPSSVSVLVVGVDFSDSLLVGRDNTMPEFAGWPTQNRTASTIPFTSLPMFAAHDSVYFDIQMRKTADYFETVSFGRLNIDWDVHGEILNASLLKNATNQAGAANSSMGYYGDEDSSAVRLVALSQLVIDTLDAEVDFGNYDTLMLIHAGAGQETDILGDSPEQIFSNYLDSRDFEEAQEAGLLDGSVLMTEEGPLEHVLILPESESQDPFPEAGFLGFFGTRGVYCFEFALRLGMINMGDFTPAGRPDSQGIGNYGLMGFGLFTGLGIVPSAPCAFNRWLMGWVDREDIEADSDLRIGAMDAVGAAVSDTLLVKIPIDDREYWLVEYRLQDPNGDLNYSFDDLNANFIPDYFDASNSAAGGSPNSTFDPATDTWESTAGSEWDYFMSENPVRSPDRCQRAGGSGLYIWHVDERVIEAALRDGDVTINSDRLHSGVDVEEADAIQDLDSPRPSAYFLGWDGDVWRGEGADEFGPETVPSTATADGLPTGIRMFGISTVVVDSTLSEDVCQSFVYRSAMTLSVEFGTANPASPSVEASHRFAASPASFDPHLVDLGTSPSDPTPDGILEIVQAGDDGRVYAFRGDLSEWFDGDADAGSIGVLAAAFNADGPVEWLGSPALADLNGDGVLELLLAASDGVYAFSSADGSEYVDADASAATFGLMASPAEGEFIGPVLVFSDLSEFAVALRGPDGGSGILRGSDPAADGNLVLVSDVVASLPALAASRLTLTAIASTPSVVTGWATDDAAGLLYFSLNSPSPVAAKAVRLPSGLSTLPTLSFDFLPGGASHVVVDTTGRAIASATPAAFEAGAVQPAGIDAELADSRVGLGGALPASGVVGAAARTDGTPVLVYATGASLWALDRNLRPRDGFPYQPSFVGEAVLGTPEQATPLLVDLTGDGRAELIWHDPVGALHAVNLQSEALDGWPFIGPAEPVGSPAVGDVDGDGELELVVGGRFDRIVDVDIPERDVLTTAAGELRVYDLGVPASSYAPWPQGMRDAQNTGRQPSAASSAGIASEGAVLVEGSLLVHPQPVRSSTIRVRVSVRRSADLSLSLYNLEGELVASAGPFTVEGGAAFDETITVDQLVSGFYLCRVSGGGDHAILPFTVVR